MPCWRAAAIITKRLETTLGFFHGHQGEDLEQQNADLFRINASASVRPV